MLLVHVHEPSVPSRHVPCTTQSAHAYWQLLPYRLPEQLERHDTCLQQLLLLHEEPHTSQLVGHSDEQLVQVLLNWLTVAVIGSEPIVVTLEQSVQDKKTDDADVKKKYRPIT